MDSCHHWMVLASYITCTNKPTNGDFGSVMKGIVNAHIQCVGKSTGLCGNPLKRSIAITIKYWTGMYTDTWLGHHAVS